MALRANGRWGEGAPAPWGACLVGLRIELKVTEQNDPEWFGNGPLK